MRKELYDNTIKPFGDLASVLYNGLIRKYATYPRQCTKRGRETLSSLSHVPCDSTRQSARSQLEKISNDSKNPIVRGLAKYFLKRSD